MRASLFVTCLGDALFADAAYDSARLLRSLGVAVDVPPLQTCCGQPAYNAGLVEEARTMALHTCHAFAGSEHVVLPSGSCTAMVRHAFSRLTQLDRRPGAEEMPCDLPAKSYELSEFIVGVLGIETLGRGLQGLRVAYHHGCHALRDLGVEREPVKLLQAAGAEVVTWPASHECCGFGGLFATKFPEISAGMADRKIDTLPEVDVLASGDAGCLMQLEGRLKRRGMSLPVTHLASLLWRAREQGSSRGDGPGGAQ